MIHHRVLFLCASLSALRTRSSVAAAAGIHGRETQVRLGADARHRIRRSRTSSYSSTTSDAFSVASLTSVRGGSDSTRAWSAGSTTGERPTSYSSSPTRPSERAAPYRTDRDATKEAIDAFLTRDSRQKFIARVYAILAGQLLVTALSVIAFGTNPKLQSWIIHRGRIVPSASLIISTIAWFRMCGSERARRESPLKWRLLALFTAGEAISVGFISSLYAFRTAVSAMVATAIATLSITAYTLLQKNPKYDLSQWGRALSSFGMIFIFYGLIHLLELFGIIPAGFLPYTESLYSLVGACLFSLYLAHHTRLIVSGKHTKFQMNEKDYVFGAMALYNDVINIFLYLLRILGDDRD